MLSRLVASRPLAGLSLRSFSNYAVQKFDFSGRTERTPFVGEKSFCLKIDRRLLKQLANQMVPSQRQFSTSSLRDQNMLASLSLGLVAKGVLPEDDPALPRGYRAATFFGVSLMLATGLISLLPIASVVPMTCQPLILMPLSITFWASLNLSSALYRPQQYFAHFLPPGVPGVLIPFLAFVEGISVFIRFITHSMRFVANHNAGHIMTPLLFMVPLTGLAGTSMYFTAGIPMGVMAGFYHLYETFVTCMQCYIYYLLLNMYAQEHTH